MTVARKGRCGVAVFDRWWPHRIGAVVKRLNTVINVEWSDGEMWRYDRAHQRFLERLDGKGRP